MMTMMTTTMTMKEWEGERGGGGEGNKDFIV
jgi:hypothetical protein